MISPVFSSDQDSHEHSRQTLEALYEYDDFMESVGSMVDMGCGSGLDLEWWATRTTRDELKTPLNIECLGIDQAANLPMADRYRNMRYQKQDFEQQIRIHKRKFDVVWCHNSFQFVVDPFATLKHWRDVMNKDGMLILILPQSTNIEFKEQAFDQRSNCYWNWTLVSLIHVLSVSGFDCAGGFFKKFPNDPWLHAVVYRSEVAPVDPRKTNWYLLMESGLLPETACRSIVKYGYLRQRDLVLPWLDKSLTWMGQH